VNLCYKTSAFTRTPRTVRRRASAPCISFLHLQIPLLLSVVLFPARLLAQSKAPSEYELKAAFLFNFAKFVDWPPAAFPDPKSPMILCTFDDDAFGVVLDEVVRAKAINGRELVVRRMKKVEALTACQVVFVGTAETKRLPELLEALKGSPTLLVSDIPGSAERGGGIGFYLEDSKMRFSINVDAIQRAHLTVSSKLLTLAKIVHDQIRGERS
jgi:YfiR/HmsC-like